jgi:hypothetical protein
MSTIMTVFASIPQDTTEKAELRRLRGTLLQEYVARFIQPMDLSSVEAAAATMVKLRGGASGGFMPMLGELRFTQMVDGRTDRVHLKLSTADARLDSALIAAALAMGIDRVSFYSSDGRDSVQMRIQLSLDPSLGFYPMKLIALRPMNLIDRSAHIIPTTIYPKWPKKLEDARVEDDVVVQVLVDRDGKPVMDSAHAVEGCRNGCRCRSCSTSTSGDHEPSRDPAAVDVCRTRGSARGADARDDGHDEVLHVAGHAAARHDVPHRVRVERQLGCGERGGRHDAAAGAV